MWFGPCLLAIAGIFIGAFVLLLLGALARLAFIVAGDIAWHLQKRSAKIQTDDAALAFSNAIRKRDSASHQRHD